eukprot:TRINITY_DN6551_c0_g1_i1.p1 TRINITY_DN6551_c0_g1~~TRINITY_DN6551_c0_g1_i1.p1  ORF type:complete len:528 (+),score=136.26 TRINITY_DN6551_c0_g1_i1:76-1659(+)
MPPFNEDGESDESSDFESMPVATIRRARPPQGRRALGGGQSPRGAAPAPPPPQPTPPPPQPSSGGARWDSSDSEGGGEGAPRAGGEVARPRGAEFSKGEQLTYASPQGPVAATVVVVDMLTEPPSYIVRLPDGAERATEASRLTRGPPSPQPSAAPPPPGPPVAEEAPTEAAAPAVAEPPAEAPPPDTGAEAAAEPEAAAEVDAAGAAPAPAEHDLGATLRSDSGPQVDDAASAAADSKKAKKAKKEKKEEKEKKEKKKEKKERRRGEEEVEDERSAVPTELPAPVHVPPAVEPLLLGVPAYVSLVVDKVSNRGFKHRRILVVTAQALLFVQENGELRRAVDIDDVRLILLQHMGGDGVCALIQLARSCPEPDVVFMFRSQGDPRNSPADLEVAMSVISRLCLVRQPDTPVHVKPSPAGADVRVLARQGEHIQKSASPYDRLAAINRNHAMVGGDKDVAVWKPDEEVRECEGCLKDFTMLRRRHHCRSCGGIFCKACSSKKIELPQLGQDKVRVCDSCFERAVSMGR